MENLTIRRAGADDIPALDKLLYQVHKVHSDLRPDLFRQGAKKYTDAELETILTGNNTPVFVAERDGAVQGYAFCVHKKFGNDSNMTGIKTLYIDDLCVDECSRGGHIGRALYEHVLDYARSCGCYNVTLNVWAGNDSAMKFYESVGLGVQKIGMERIL